MKDLIDKSVLIFNQLLPVLLGKITTAFNDFSTGIIIIIAFYTYYTYIILLIINNSFCIFVNM